MRYYLDTHILIFIITDEHNDIHYDVRDILTDYSNLLFTSSIAVQELLFLNKIGKIRSRKKISEKDLLTAIVRAGIEVVYFNDKHLRQYSELVMSPKHKDMNDLAIIAQSISDRIPLISSDHAFGYYTNQGLDLVFNKR